MNVALLVVLLTISTDAMRPFAIDVIDDECRRGVPLVELTTTSGITHVTDSAGLVAFDEPGLMNQEVFFYVKSPADSCPPKPVQPPAINGVHDTIRPADLRIQQRLLNGRLAPSLIAGNVITIPTITPPPPSTISRGES